MRTIVAAVSSFALATLAIAGQAPRTSILAMPESSWHKRSGDFLVHLSVSTQARAFLSEWDGEARRGGAPPALVESTEVTTTPTGVEFGVFLIFSNCPLNSDDKCAAVVTYQLLSPEGKLLFEHPNVPLWHWRPPKKNAVELSESYWYSSAEASDPPGDYRLRAIVLDEASGNRIVLERTLRHP